MSRGKRYETEGKLNYQKVFAVIIAIVVIIMFVLIIKDILAQRSKLNKEYDYFAVYSADKWGVINQDGEYVINPSYQEMIVIPDKTKDVFICTYDVDDTTGTYKTKALNKNNEEIFTQYEQILPIENFDENENLWYEQDVLKVMQNGKYGLINLNGKQILPCEYDNITVIQGIENSLIIEKNGQKGLCNDSGSVLIEPQYTEIKNLGETYKDGYITVNSEGKYGVISATKQQILENKFDEIKQTYLGSNYLVIEGGKEKLVNSSGETLIENGFDDIKSNTTRGVIFVLNNLYGEMSTSGEILIEAKYQDLKQVKEGIYIAKQNDKYGIIDESIQEKLPFSYTGITYNDKANLFIAEDENFQTSIIDKDYNVKLIGVLVDITTDYIRMRINNEYKYFNLNCEEIPSTEALKDNTLFLKKENDKYGYVDKNGNVVVDYVYDDATEQNEYGFVAVKQNGLWGSLDKEGKIVIEPKYNLDNYLYINFIGKWHFGLDLNMNYYCED